MTNSKKLLALVVSLIMALALALTACEGETPAAATLNSWNIPTFYEATVGDNVYVPAVRATDTLGNQYTAAVEVRGPKGQVAVSANSFNVEYPGTYTVIYTVTFNGQSFEKYTTFQAKEGGPTPAEAKAVTAVRKADKAAVLKAAKAAARRREAPFWARCR